jgi:hypothetical protein
MSIDKIKADLKYQECMDIECERWFLGEENVWLLFEDCKEE